MQGVLLAVLYPLRWLAYRREEGDAPPPGPAAIQLPGSREAA